MVTRDVFQLELEKRSVVQATTDPVTGRINIYGQIVVPGLVVGDSSAPSATANTAAIQSALNSGGDVVVAAQGVIYINATIALKSHSTLRILNGTTIKATPTMGKVMFVNAGYSAVPESVGAGNLTASGLLATLAQTGIGALYPINSNIYITGAVEQSYNGVWRVTASSANSISWQLENPASAATATGSITHRAADTNIQITGGGTIDYDGAVNNSAQTLYDACACIFFGCDTPVIENIFFKNVKKYTTWFSATTNASAKRLRMNTLSDGVHVCGPSRGVATIDQISGYCGDDIVGLSNGDNPTGELSRGEISHVRISNIAGENSAIALVSIVGGGSSAIRYKTVEIDGLYGTCAGGALNIYEYVTGGATLSATYIENLVVRNIAPSGWSNGGCIYINGTTSGSTIENMTVENIKPCNTLTGQQAPIWLDSGATVKALKVRGLEAVFGAGTTGGGFKMTNSAIAHDVSIDWFKISPTSSSNALVQTQSGNTLSRLFLSNGQVIGNTAGYFLGLSHSGDVYVSNCYSSTTNSAINVVQSGAVVNLRTKNWRNSAGSTTATLAVSGATLNWYGDCDSGTAKCNVQAGATFRCKGTMLVDASFVNSAVAGDTMYNGNTSWSGGSGADKSGFYGYNGSTWTKIFGPA